MKIICLASGGIDSSVMLYMLKQEKNEVIPLFIDYGHKASEQEKMAFKRVCKKLELEPNIIDLNALSQIKCGLTTPELSEIDFPTFPGRNLIFAAIGSSFAFNHASRILAFGFLKDSEYPDQTKEFSNMLEKTVTNALGVEFKILTPFIEMDKREIIKLANKYNFTLDETYSCHKGSKKPCEKCKGCNERNQVL